MAKSQKPRKRAPTTQHKKHVGLSNELSKGSFSLNILRLAEHSVMNVLNGSIVRTPQQARAYFKTLDVPRQWSITYGCICRSPDGKEYISHFFMRFRTQHRFEELDEDLQSCLDEAVDDVNKEHILSPYYIASPEGREFTETQVFELIHTKNAFSRLHTLYELNREKALGIEELKGVDISPFLPKTDKALATILKRNNLNSLYEVRMLDRKGLLALKGISEKRMGSIENAFYKAVTECSLEHYNKFLCIYNQYNKANQFMEKYKA